MHLLWIFRIGILNDEFRMTFIPPYIQKQMNELLRLPQMVPFVLSFNTAQQLDLVNREMGSKHLINILSALFSAQFMCSDHVWNQH